MRVQAKYVRSIALAQGAAWTAGIAAVPACLKFLDLEPIPIVQLNVLSLIVMALGWALLLVKVLEREQRVTLERLAVAGAAVRDAIDNLAEVMGAQMSGARAEMLRADQLLGDAIERLVEVFEALAERVRAQSELAQAAAADPCAAAEGVASDVNCAVMALQFRDMVGQKLGHVRDRLVAAEETMYEIRLVSARSAQAVAAGLPDAPQPAELAARVCQCLQKLQRAEAGTPVRQRLMLAGEVELF